MKARGLSHATRSVELRCSTPSLLAITTISVGANERERTLSGPPDSVVQAWERGELPRQMASGPPTWVIEAWQNGERPQRPFGPPPWIARCQNEATELGLPGPPSEVQEAWRRGQIDSLPGPPSFLSDLFGL